MGPALAWLLRPAACKHAAECAGPAAGRLCSPSRPPGVWGSRRCLGPSPTPGENPLPAALAPRRAARSSAERIPARPLACGSTEGKHRSHLAESTHAQLTSSSSMPHLSHCPGPAPRSPPAHHLLQVCRQRRPGGHKRLDLAAAALPVLAALHLRGAAWGQGGAGVGTLWRAVALHGQPGSEVETCLLHARSLNTSLRLPGRRRRSRVPAAPAGLSSAAAAARRPRRRCRLPAALCRW